MDWPLRVVAFLFVLCFVYLAVLTVARFIASEIAVWRRNRDASDWLTRRAAHDERRVRSELRPRSNNVERH